MTRSHATSTTSNIATSSTVAPPTVHDHNYVGDAGPSTSSAANRNTRRIFSRHQRNTDEHDSSLDTLENSLLLSAATRLRRGLPTSTTAAPASTSPREISTQPQQQQATVPVRRGRSRFSQENSQTEPSADENVPDHDDDDDDDDGEGVSDMGTGGCTDTSITDDASDSEDNQPLTSYVPKTKRGRKPVRKRRLSDDSFVADEDDEYGKRRHKDGNRKERGVGGGSGRSNSRRTQRGSRNQKRPRYNELSDEEDANSRGRKSRNEFTPAVVTPTVVAPTASTVVVGSSAVAHYDHDASTMDSDDDDQLVSVSSRGRVRKITAKARGIFKE